MTEQTADSFEVSPQQEQLWLAHPDGPARTRPGDPRPRRRSSIRRRCRRRCAASVERHEILRTTFVHRPGHPGPAPGGGRPARPGVGELDLSDARCRRTGRPRSSAWPRRSALRRSTSPTGPAASRARLVRLSPSRHALVLTLSALCADASSASTPDRRAPRAYSGTAEPTDPLQYADFAAWQRELQDADDDEATSAAREFWSGLEDLSPPPRSVLHPGHGPVRRPSAIPPRLDAGPRGVSRARRPLRRRRRTVVHAAWLVVLGRSAGAARCSRWPRLGAERRHADLAGRDRARSPARCRSSRR